MMVVLALFIGVCLGSFSSALIHRIPQKQSIFLKAPRSKCTSCDATLGVFNLIPVVSWLMQKGRCHSCSTPISVMYPLVEILSAVLCCVVYLRFGFSPQGLVLMALVPVLVTMAVIDIKYMILPNVLVLSAFVLGVLSLFLNMFENVTDISGAIAAVAHLGAYSNLLAMVVYGGFLLSLGGGMKFLLKKEALGMGDVKLFAVAGLWLGFAPLPLYAMLSGMMGVAYVLIAGLIKKGGASSLFPFGPALISALFVLLVIQGSNFF
jgi:leader peptidase (prepilin peptidase)/N-methyltransferase